MLHGPWSENLAADVLAKLASSCLSPHAAVSREVLEFPFIAPGWIKSLEEGKSTWMDPFIKYLQDGVVPDEVKPHIFRSQASWFTIVDGELHKRGFSTPILKCLTEEDSTWVLEEVHAGLCGNHEGARALVHKLLAYGYFWLSMRKDTRDFIRRCDPCQRFTDVQHNPPA